MHANGDAKEPQGIPLDQPRMILCWDAEKQSVGLHFDNREFTNWEMVLMILEGARLKAESQRKFAEAMQMQQQMAEQMQAQMMAQQLKLKPGR